MTVMFCYRKCRSRQGFLLWGILGCLLAFLLVGCSRQKEPSPSPGTRYDLAKAVFEQTTRSFHLPSAEAKGADRQRLQSEAMAGYERLLKAYPDQEYWAAQAIRSIGNIYAAQTNVAAAISYYSRVETRYPREEWQVLMAWKSAADLLYESGRRDEAKQFYTKIIRRFDTPDAGQVVKIVVRGSKLRLEPSESTQAG
jgi:tetratricopeptide (TPR) repeat protein